MSEIIKQILGSSSYGLTQFETETRSKHIKELEKSVIKNNGTYKVKCLIRDKEIKLTPEEIVRQLYLAVLMKEFGYKKDRIQVEYPVTFGREIKKADICVFDKKIQQSPIF